jgi:hypothetical protein
MNVKKLNGVVWIGFIWLRIWTSGELLWTQYKLSATAKRWEFLEQLKVWEFLKRVSAVRSYRTFSLYLR